MPLTVITLKKVPNSLRGDLTKWMQEIATGVYVGNFNSKIRVQLWQRVIENVGSGEATLTYAARNELGYQFESLNSDRLSVNFDGIPLVRLPDKKQEASNRQRKKGFSNAAKFRQARKYAGNNSQVVSHRPFVVIDIETSGLNPDKDQIIELAGVKVTKEGQSYLKSLVKANNPLPKNIVDLTGITDEKLQRKGKSLKEALQEFLDFIGDLELVGYNVNFDLRFLNTYLKKSGLPLIHNKFHDLIRYIKKEKMFLKNYKLETILKEYGVANTVPHRALELSLIHI